MITRAKKKPTKTDRIISLEKYIRQLETKNRRLFGALLDIRKQDNAAAMLEIAHNAVTTELNGEAADK